MKNKIIKIDAIEKGEICKSRMIKTFNKVYKKEKNSHIAYNKALDNLNMNIEKLSISNIRQTAVLKGELIYYYNNFKQQSLSTEMAVGFKGDYRGIINNKPAIVDVTTNPVIKNI